MEKVTMSTPRCGILNRMIIMMLLGTGFAAPAQNDPPNDDGYYGGPWDFSWLLQDPHTEHEEFDDESDAVPAANTPATVSLESQRSSSDQYISI